MHRVRLLLAAGLWLAPLLTLAAHGAELGGKDPRTGQAPPLPPSSPPVVNVLEDAKGTCGNHGTTIHFVNTPQAAAEKAAREEKLVLVLHLSGIFENPKFT